ncbi:hypothetical protein GTZ99_12440 [Novosphingobium sp. FSY-8]|uniref:Uncharacterized protein n=1 Tax=Novosphingobium ovatum TaxID=1908523 RepID=A0ABW9XFP5_9SPHN|nr:hypothetical protein [Novosphingobium ovatum]NBC37359.1 hypothetical protein [Novosphingobium ovatum]
MFAGAFAAIARGFSAACGGPFADVQVYIPGSPTFDAGGSIVTPAAGQTLTCQAMFDAPTEKMRSDPGFVERDMRVEVLASTLAGALTTACRLIVATGANAGVWQLQSVDLDPLGIGYECRARKVA